MTTEQKEKSTQCRSMKCVNCGDLRSVHILYFKMILAIILHTSYFKTMADLHLKSVKVLDGIVKNKLIKFWQACCTFIKAFQGPVMCDIERDMAEDRRKCLKDENFNNFLPLLTKNPLTNDK